MALDLLSHVSVHSCSVIKQSFVLFQVNLDDLFSPLQFRCVRRSGLTLLREDDEPEQTSRISRLRAMEISAFRVEIN